MWRVWFRTTGAGTDMESRTFRSEAEARAFLAEILEADTDGVIDLLSLVEWVDREWKSHEAIDFRHQPRHPPEPV